jgi:hypothetical protein
MGIFNFLITSIALLFVAAFAFMIIDVSSEVSPHDPIVDNTANDVRTGISFLHRPVDESTFTYSLLGLLGLIFLYGLYRTYRWVQSGTGGA